MTTKLIITEVEENSRVVQRADFYNHLPFEDVVDFIVNNHEWTKGDAIDYYLEGVKYMLDCFNVPSWKTEAWLQQAINRFEKDAKDNA